jgi:hypothetical protein
VEDGLNFKGYTMKKIILSLNPENVNLNLKGKVLCVYHKNYLLPRKQNWKYILFQEFQYNARDYINNIDHLVIVGLTNLLNPGNRCDMVWEILMNNTTELSKISIDRVLFISKPWRLWFHFGVINAKYLQYTYSYVAESHYNAWIRGTHPENPFSIDTIKKYGNNVIFCEYKKYFTNINIETIKLDSNIHKEYQLLKEECFKKFSTIHKIITELSKFAKNSCPQRNIPSQASIFSKRSHKIIKTDLKIDEYIVSERLKLVSLTNKIAGEFYGNGRI